MTTELCDLSLWSIARAIRQRRASCVEVMESCLARIELEEPKLNAFITLLAAEAKPGSKQNMSTTRNRIATSLQNSNLENRSLDKRKRGARSGRR